MTRVILSVVFPDCASNSDDYGCVLVGTVHPRGPVCVCGCLVLCADDRASAQDSSLSAVER